MRGIQVGLAERASRVHWAAVMAAAESAGLRLLTGQRPRSWWQRVVGVRILATDVDEESGIAVVCVIASLLPWIRRLSCDCQYEFRAGQWHSGGAGATDAEPGFPGQRLSWRQRGPAVILVGAGAGGGRASDGSWVAYQTYRAAQEVWALDIEGRISMIPWHGYCVVTWKSSQYDGLVSRPTIKAIGFSGEVLTEFRGGEYVDTASLAFITNDGEARGADNGRG